MFLNNQIKAETKLAQAENQLKLKDFAAEEICFSKFFKLFTKI